MNLVRKRIATLGIILISFVICPGILTSQTKHVQDKAKGKTPVADFETSSKGSSERQQKSNRYDHPGKKPLVEMQPGYERLPLVGHWWSGTGVLPVEKSDLVVLGSVESAEAFLSNDKTDVYSEFGLRIDEVLQNSGAVAVSVGQKISAERTGGAVRFKSGRVQEYRTYDQGMPDVGKQYVLFLAYNAAGNTFSILTGYEINNSKIRALDGSQSGELAFTTLDGIDGSQFFTKLKEAVATKGKGGKVR